MDEDEVGTELTLAEMDIWIWEMLVEILIQDGGRVSGLTGEPRA